MDSRELFAPQPKSFHVFSYSFRGCHLRRKAAILLALTQHPSGVPASRITEESGCLRATVLNSFSRWARYSRPYALRRREQRGRRHLWIYRISAKGRRFLEEHLPDEVRLELEEELGIGEYAPSDAAITAARTSIATTILRLRQNGAK
jgi:hypothetical protein